MAIAAELPRIFQATDIPLVEALEAACRHLCVAPDGRFVRPTPEEALQAIHDAGISVPATHRGILEALRELVRGFEIINGQFDGWEPLLAWKWVLVEAFLAPCNTGEDVLAKVELVDSQGDELTRLWQPDAQTANLACLRDSIMRDIASLMVP